MIFVRRNAMASVRKSKIFEDRRNWVKSIARRLDIHASVKVVAFVISEFCNPKTGEAYASIGTIAEASGLSERTTSRAISALLQQGLLSKRPPGKGRHTNTYRMRVTQAEKVVELTRNTASQAKRAMKDKSADQSYVGRYQDWLKKIAEELGGRIEGFVILQKFTDNELREAFRQSNLTDQSIQEAAIQLARLATDRRDPNEDMGPFSDD